SGVAFTRDPATGEKALYADFLRNAQGEDVVSGRYRVEGGGDLRGTAPALYRELYRLGGQLETLFRDAQDIEFTLQEGRLYLLQARRAKRTAWAALRIACDLVAEGVVDRREALARVAELDLAAVQRLRLGPAEGQTPLSIG